jgi:hypothetical protein
MTIKTVNFRVKVDFRAEIEGLREIISRFEGVAVSAGNSEYDIYFKKNPDANEMAVMLKSAAEL